MVWNVASMVPVQDFGGCEIIAHDVGVRLENVKAKERPTMPEWALCLCQVTSFENYGGPLGPEQGPCVVCSAADVCGVAPIAGVGDTRWGCNKCSCIWHHECALRFDPDAFALVGVAFTSPLCS